MELRQGQSEGSSLLSGGTNHCRSSNRQAPSSREPPNFNLRSSPMSRRLLPDEPACLPLNPRWCVRLKFEAWSFSGSLLFSVELELGQAEFAGGEVKHGNEVRGGTVAARFAFGRTEDAVQAFHERIGHAPLPVRHHACQMVLDQWHQLDHRSQETGVVKACHPAPPAAPDLETSPGQGRGGTAVDVLEHQPHLIRLGGAELFVFDFGQPRLLQRRQVLRVFAPEPLAFAEGFPDSLAAQTHFGPPHLVHRLVGVFDHMKLVEHHLRVPAVVTRRRQGHCSRRYKASKIWPCARAWRAASWPRCAARANLPAQPLPMMRPARRGWRWCAGVTSTGVSLGRGCEVRRARWRGRLCRGIFNAIASATSAARRFISRIKRRRRWRRRRCRCRRSSAMSPAKIKRRGCSMGGRGGKGPANWRRVWRRCKRRRRGGGSRRWPRSATQRR